MSLGMPMGLVTRYMCSAAISGTETPHMRPTSLAHMPAQLTMYSHSISAPVGRDAGHGAVPLVDGRHLGLFEQGRARALGGGGHRHRGVSGDGLAVLRDVDGAHDVVGNDQGQPFAGLPRADLVNLDAKHAPQRYDVPELVHSPLGAGDRDAADLPEARGPARLGLQGGVQVNGVPGKLDQRLGGAKLGDQPGGVPGGAASQLPALQDHDVLPAQPGEVVGDTGARDASANHDDARSVRQ